MVKQLTKHATKHKHQFEDFNIQDSSFSLYSVFWWLKFADQKNFELSIDLDRPKLFIFLNTLMMNNFSISKKLSHSDSYISQNNPEQFKFEFHKIFARKPLKKIKRNVMSKFTKLILVKMLIRQEFISGDDVMFISILCFHQLCFLYYAQMNCSSNYLKIFAKYKHLSWVQQLLKRYSKGISLLVKINKKFLKTHASHFSLKILAFLAQMQFAMGLKHIVMSYISKKFKTGFGHIKELQVQQFYRVSAPTILLYLVVIFLHQSGVCGVSSTIEHCEIKQQQSLSFIYKMFAQLQYKLDRVLWPEFLSCDLTVQVLEYSYIVWFIYRDHLIKLHKAELKKQFKKQKGAGKKNDEVNDRFESNDEDFQGLSKRMDGGSTNQLSEEEPSKSKRLPLARKDLIHRGLKSHLALNEVKANLKNSSHFPALLKENLMQNMFQNRSQSLKQIKQAGMPRIETKFKTYLNSTRLTTIEEEHMTHYYSTNSAMTSN